MTQTAAVNNDSAPAPKTGLFSDDLKFRLHCLNRDCFALPMLKYRDFQGFMITGPHSGTHWTKWMLSNAIAHHYDLDPPRYFNNPSPESNDFIGHPKHAPKYPDLPRLATSHSIPPYPVQWRWARNLLGLPRYAVVVRDIRNVLISNYEKWRETYGVSFSEYLRGDPWGKTYVIDAWLYIRFMNRWGEVARRFPEETLVLRYEDFRADAATSLDSLARFLGLDLTEEDIAAGVAAGAKDVMAKHHDPAVEVQALRPDGKGDTVYSEEDEAFLRDMLKRNLKHDFGYDFFEENRGFRPELARAA